MTAALKKSKYGKLPGFGEKTTSPLLLQDHGNAVWFRKIRIRDLSADAKPQR